MAIQAQQPAQIPSAPSASGADVLALLTGKPVDARVLNITPDGLTMKSRAWRAATPVISGA